MNFSRIVLLVEDLTTTLSRFGQQFWIFIVQVIFFLFTFRTICSERIFRTITGDGGGGGVGFSSPSNFFSIFSRLVQISDLFSIAYAVAYVLSFLCSCTYCCLCCSLCFTLLGRKSIFTAPMAFIFTEESG